jgi:hypothetical protein
MRKLALLLTLVTPALAQSPLYRITHTYPLGGEGSWDYIVPDAPNHRLFIARQNRLMVVDEDSGKLPSPQPRDMASPPRGTTSPSSCSI